MPDAAFPIEPSMAPRFRLEAWDALDDDGRRRPGRIPLRAASGPGLGRARADDPDDRRAARRVPIGPPVARTGLGPDLLDDPWGDVPAGLRRLPVDPGRGIDPPGFRGGGRRGRYEGPAVDPSLGLKPPVDVAPFFLATELVRPSLPGLRAVAKLPEDAAKGKALYGYDFTGDAIEFPWNQVEPVLDHFRWSLPTSAEFEWALRGGVSSVFYWGDDFPEFMEDVDVGWRGAVGPDQARAKAAFDACLSAAFDPDRPREWPWCNRFGLAAMLPRNTWCAGLDRARRPGAADHPGGRGPLLPLARRLLRVDDAPERLRISIPRHGRPEGLPRHPGDRGHPADDPTRGDGVRKLPTIQFMILECDKLVKSGLWIPGRSTASGRPGNQCRCSQSTLQRPYWQALRCPGWPADRSGEGQDRS